MKSRQIDFEHFLFYAILTFLAMFAFSICAHSQTSVPTPPFKPEFLNEWVTLLTASAVYILTFLSYKIPFLNRITSTSVRYIVIALVSFVFVLSFGLTDLLGGLAGVGLPSFVAVILKALFGLSTPKAQPKPKDNRTPEQKIADRLAKEKKMKG
jgi:hypothetical protein